MNDHGVATRIRNGFASRSLLFALAILASQAGCASITRGTTEEVEFISVPPGARVYTQPATVDCVTPCYLELKSKKHYIVNFELKGYEPAQERLTPKFAGAGAAGFAGNILIGGLIGMGVDTATGASKVLRPNPLKVTLVPKPGQPAPQAGSEVQAPAVPTIPAPEIPAPPAALVSQCIQPALVDREACLGRLRLGMTKVESVALLGTPDGASRDQKTHRYGDRYLKFDAADVLTAIGDKP